MMLTDKEHVPFAPSSRRPRMTRVSERVSERVMERVI
jgi:hypothetical protein